MRDGRDRGAVATRLFSDDHLERLRSFPDIGRDELIRFFTLTSHRDVLRVLSSMALLDAAAVGGAIQRMEQGRAGGWPASLSVWLTKRRCVPMSPPTKPPTCCGYWQLR